MYLAPPSSTNCKGNEVRQTINIKITFYKNVTHFIIKMHNEICFLAIFSPQLDEDLLPCGSTLDMFYLHHSCYLFNVICRPIWWPLCVSSVSLWPSLQSIRYPNILKLLPHTVPNSALRVQFCPPHTQHLFSLYLSISFPIT